jgi:hypothetical protein
MVIILKSCKIFPMYTTCPKCQHLRQAADETSTDICPGCGLVFSKWLKSLALDMEFEDSLRVDQLQQTWKLSLFQFFCPSQANIAKGDFFLYLAIWVIFFAWGIDFITMDFRTNKIGLSWFHNIDLVFHEAGHLLFIPFGRTMSIFGGSLLQVLVPFFLVFTFLIRNRDGFAASIGLWWTGQSMMDLAPYIADARALQLPLLGGAIGADGASRHDWANLLGPRGWLEYDIQIATGADLIGSGILLIALVWGAYMLSIYYKEMVD